MTSIFQKECFNCRIDVPFEAFGNLRDFDRELFDADREWSILHPFVIRTFCDIFQIPDFVIRTVNMVNYECQKHGC